MTSKQALENICIDCELRQGCEFWEMRTKKRCEDIEAIKRDLEILEIFKKHIREDFSYSMLMIDNDELSKEEIKKIGKWLKNEKN